MIFTPTPPERYESDLTLETWESATGAVQLTVLRYTFGQRRVQVWFGPYRDIVLEM